MFPAACALPPAQCGVCLHRSQAHAQPRMAAGADCRLKIEPASSSRTWICRASAEHQSVGGSESIEQRMETEFGLGPSKRPGANTRPMVSFARPNGGPLQILLEHPNHSSAVVSTSGASVLSWRSSTGTDLLFRSRTGPGPVFPCFPQAGSAGPLQRGGFARDLEWEVAGTSCGPWDRVLDPAPTVTLVATDNDATREAWPHAFKLQAEISLMETDEFPKPRTWVPGRPETLPEGHPIRVALGSSAPPAKDKKKTSRAKSPEGPLPEGASEEVAIMEEEEVVPEQLRYVLAVTNTGDGPMRFTAAVNQSVAVLDTRDEFCRMLGLGGMRFIDYADPSDPLLFVDTSDYTWFPMDKDLTRLYLEATDEGDIMLCPGNRTYMQMLNRQGFSEMAVMSKTHTDPSGWRYVGLHPGMYMRQITLQPGESWTGESALRWHNKYWQTPRGDKTAHPVPPRTVIG